jgi:hypothetical protein
LLGLRFRGTLLLLVLELAVVHQAAHRWISLRGNLDQIDIELARDAQGLLRAHDSERFVVDSVEANLGRGDLTVESVLALDVGSATVSKSSDGVCLSKVPRQQGPQKIVARLGVKPSERCH